MVAWYCLLFCCLLCLLFVFCYRCCNKLNFHTKLGYTVQSNWNDLDGVKYPEWMSCEGCMSGDSDECEWNCLSNRFNVTFLIKARETLEGRKSVCEVLNRVFYWQKDNHPEVWNLNDQVYFGVILM